MSTKFVSSINLEASNLGYNLLIDVANGKFEKPNRVVRRCILELNNYSFEVDLIPFKLGSFDIVIGMDWMSKNNAEIICRDKISVYPYPTVKF